MSLSGLVGTRACTQTQQGKRAVGAQRKEDLLCKWMDVGGGRERFLRGQSELGVKGMCPQGCERVGFETGK